MFVEQTMAGGVTSATVTVAMQVADRPIESVTTNVMPTEPLPSIVPMAGVWRKVTQQQLSVTTSWLERSGRGSWHWPGGSASVVLGQERMEGGVGLVSLLTTSTRAMEVPPVWPSETM